MAEVRGGAEGALTESPGLQPKCIPENSNNRECVLIFWMVRYGRDHRKGKGVLAKDARRVWLQASNQRLRPSAR